MQKTKSSCFMSVAPVLLVVAGLATAGLAAPISPLTDRASCDAAVSAPDWLADFEGCATDTPVQTPPVEFGRFSLVDVGALAFHSVIEAGECADTYVDFGAISVGMAFDIPQYAQDADFTGLDGEPLNLELAGGGSVTVEIARSTDVFSLIAP